MSTLETNSIGKYSGNNISVDDALNLKSYTTAQRDALTSVAGDMIYNSTTGKVEHYNGTSWQSGVNVFELEYLIIAGGGAGGYGSSGPGVEASGGGGAGGYLCKYASETSGGGSVTLNSFYVIPSTNYPVTIGAGGTGQTGYDFNSANNGFPSYVGSLYAIGGGGGAKSFPAARQGGSGGGGGPRYNPDGGSNGDGGSAVYAQGSNGGNWTGTAAVAPNAGGGGGGAGAAGSNGSSGTGGAGGAGKASSITGSSVTRAGGGGGAGTTAGGSGGTGGGGAGSDGGTPTAGTVNTGGGGGASANSTNASASGGSGVVILRYPNTFTITIGAGLTAGTETTDGSDKYIEITAGTGTVSWA